MMPSSTRPLLIINAHATIILATQRAGNGYANIIASRHIKTKKSITDSAVAKQLVDKIYEKRKAAALELEK